MMRGEALKYLQRKVGVFPDASFGPKTASAVAAHYRLSANRGAHLMGQIAHESMCFQVTEENLNYSAETMCKVWPSRFDSIEAAMPYARNPDALAEKVYGGRMGNDQPGDGAKFKGRGFIQLTGRDNVSRFARDVKMTELLDDPSPLAEELAFDSALWFFKVNGLFEIADQGVSEDVILQITRRVNGGTHGLDDRIAWTNKIHTWLR